MKMLQKIGKLILLALTCTLVLLSMHTLYQRYLSNSDSHRALGRGSFSLRWQQRNSDKTFAKLRGISNSPRIDHGTVNNPPRTSLPCTNHTHIQTTEDLYQNLVYVTAFSDNHFTEAQDMLTSVSRCLPQKKILVYDIGLKKKNKFKLTKKYRNIEIRPFPFEDYKHLMYVSFLTTYAWKPIIVKLVSLEYDVIMYGDASMRMISCDITRPLAQLLQFPFFGCHPAGARAIEFTHPGMIEYLNFPKRRQDMSDVPVLEANAWLMWVNPITCVKLIEPWLDCALHRECITPIGARIRPCHFTNDHDGHFINCHRYDQSALNLILAREFGMNVTLRASNKKISDTIWTIRRS